MIVEVETTVPGADLRAELDRHASQLDSLGPRLAPLLHAHFPTPRGLQPTDLFSVHEGEGLAAIQDVVARLRGQPEEIRQLPALRHTMGILAALTGNLADAAGDFRAVTELASAPRLKAEAWANVYLLSLEQGHWPEAVAALQSAAALDAGFFPVGKYEPQRILWANGYGVSVLCRHRNSDTSVAILLLHPEVLDRPVQQIFHEIQVLEDLEHPATIRLRDCDFADAARSRPFLVEDWFEGATLTEWVNEHGPLPPADLLALLRPVSEALRAAHGKGLLHRDLRPGNILVRKEGTTWRVKLINFGLALHLKVIRTVLDNPALRSGTILGGTVLQALEFAAPEQLGRVEEETLGPPADVYGFGKTGYFALLRTADPADDEKERLEPTWRKLLAGCTSWTTRRRLANFDLVLERLTPPAPAPAAPAPAAPPAAAPASPRVTGLGPPPGPVAQPVQLSRTPAASPQRPAPVPARPPVPQPPAEDVGTIIHRGIALWQKAEHDRALAEFSRALQIDPRNALAFQARGNTYSSKGEYERAVADYTDALRLDPRLTLAYVNRGLAYTKLRDSDQAVADFTAALKLEPRLALAYLNRGTAFARKGDYDRAIADFTHALQIEPRLALAYFNRGLAHSKKGEVDAAITDFTHVMEIDPTNADAKARRDEALRTRQRKNQVQAQAQVQQTPAPPPAAAKKPAVEVAPAAELKLFAGHGDAVRCVVFSPDGRRIISGSEDKTIAVWDPKTAQLLKRFTGHSGGVTSVACTPRGDRILSGSQDHSVRLWNLETGDEIRRFGSGRFFGVGGHSDAVVSVAISPNGQQALSAGWDKTIRLWDVESGKEVRNFNRHNWLIHSVAFAPDGTHFIYASEDQMVRLCDLKDGQEVLSFQGHGSWVLSVAFSRDGKLILSGSSDGTMRLWSANRARELRRFGGQMGVVQSVAFSPTGQYALSGEYTLPGENTLLRVWDVESGLEMARYSGHTQIIWSVAFSPDGRLALSGSADRTIRLWKLPH